MLIPIASANIRITFVAQWMVGSLRDGRATCCPNRLGNAHGIGVSAFHSVRHCALALLAATATARARCIRRHLIIQSISLFRRPDIAGKALIAVDGCSIESELLSILAPLGVTAAVISEHGRLPFRHLPLLCCVGP